MNRIEWTDTGHAGQAGHVEIAGQKIKIASISYSVTRNDPKPWALRTEIPGWTNTRHHESTDAAKESAERILTSFVTAMRPPAPTMSEVRVAAENAHESGYPNALFGDFLHGFQCAVNWLNGGRG
jgi:hypothetical protein